MAVGNMGRNIKCEVPDVFKPYREFLEYVISILPHKPPSWKVIKWRRG